jgi:predicted metal-dependent phosphotriesterase family hydrolase
LPGDHAPYKQKESPLIQTVLGPIEAKDAGMTYAHEHILTRPPLWRIKEDPDYVLDSIPKILAELERFYQAGGRMIVDATAIDYGRDARDLIKVAEQTQVAIVAITGFNRGDYADDWLAAMSVEEMTDLCLSDIRQGMDGTEARAGMVKAGASYGFLRPIEERYSRCAGRTQKETGCPVIVHTTLGTMAHEQLDLMEQEGADVNKIGIAHLDQNLDFEYLDSIAKRGASVMFDGPSKIKYTTDEQRIIMLNRLVDAGHEDRLMISGDMGRRSYLKGYGGGPGFEYILNQFIPRLRSNGWDDGLVEKVFITNPAHWLDF